MLMMAKMGGMLGGGGGPPVLQTSPYTYSAKYNALLAGADGDGSGLRNNSNVGDSSNFGSTDAGPGASFLRTDLGAVKFIDRVILRPISNLATGGWSSVYSRDTRIQISSDGSSWTQMAQASNISTDGDTPYSYDIKASGRYVRLVKQSGDASQGYIAVGDFQVWAVD